MWQLLQQKCTDIAYPSQYDNKLEVNTNKSYKIRCHTFAWEPATILNLAIIEYKR